MSSTLAQLQARLTAGNVSSRGLVEQCLRCIADPAGEGSRTYLRVFADEALVAADASDRRRAESGPVSALDGIPVAVKDLFDVAGYTTLAGSVVREGDPPARRDAAAVARLRAAGAVLLGTTNMNEFALGTTGTNAHRGTPANPWDRASGRCPGGSSSGCAVAITDGMAAVTVGTDTAGSVRVPAALCGLVGFKPTARRLSRQGVFPLSQTLDSVGCLGRSVACVSTLDALLADEPSSGGATALQGGPGEHGGPGERGERAGRAASEPGDLPLSGCRLAVLTTLVLHDLDGTVRRVTDAAIAALSAAGAQCSELSLPALEQLPELGRHGGLSLFEARQVHRERLEQHGDRFDPLVAKRLALAEAITPARHSELLATRSRIIAKVAPLTAPFEALLMPTCPTVAPTLAEVADEQRWVEINGRFVLWNIIANLLDRCALTLPCALPGEAPVGLTLMGEHDGDGRLLTLGNTVEAVLQCARRDSPAQWTTEPPTETGP